MEQESIVQASVDLLITKLQQRIAADAPGESTIVDILQWLNYTTFDTIGSLLWGFSFGCLENVRSHP